MSTKSTHAFRMTLKRLFFVVIDFKSTNEGLLEAIILTKFDLKLHWSTFGSSNQIEVSEPLVFEFLIKSEPK